jgi:hypothetical protein
MFVDAEISITIRLNDFYVHSKLNEQEMDKALLDEGEKRIRHYLSGYLFDPNGKVVDKKVIIKNKKG